MFIAYFHHLLGFRNGWYKERKVIADYGQILEMLRFCTICASISSVEGTFSGANLTVDIQCLNNFCRHSR